MEFGSFPSWLNYWGKLLVLCDGFKIHQELPPVGYKEFGSFPSWLNYWGKLLVLCDGFKIHQKLSPVGLDPSPVG